VCVFGVFLWCFNNASRRLMLMSHDLLTFLMIPLQLGGPLLADPKNTITMSLSPLTSRSSTPPTPLTGLTIPSPGLSPEDNHKSIPLPPSPSAPGVNTSDRAEESIEDEGMHPADIPLPPSPKTKQALPFRRPRVSNPLERVVSSNQRTSSGRRVSSALQYAMTPPLDTEFDTTHRAVSGESDASLDLACYQEMVTEAMSASDEDIEEIPWDSSLGFGGQLPDLVSEQGIVGEEDEAWMGFVRAQLNTLFPDFFDPNTREEDEGEGGGDVSISTIASSDLTTPPIGTRLGPGLGLGRGVPNIRSEIGGLTEEIERLRGVVTGLADGMRAAQLAPEVEGLPEGEANEAVVPESFLKVSSPTYHLLIPRLPTYRWTSSD
jgi:hypothetical protein